MISCPSAIILQIVLLIFSPLTFANSNNTFTPGSLSTQLWIGNTRFPYDLGSPLCPCFRSQVLDSIVRGVIQNQIYSPGIHMERNGCLKFNRMEHWWPTSGSIRQRSPGSHCFCFLPKDLHQNTIKKRANLFFSFPSCLFWLYSCLLCVLIQSSGLLSCCILFWGFLLFPKLTAAFLFGPLFTAVLWQGNSLVKNLALKSCSLLLLYTK